MSLPEERVDDISPKEESTMIVEEVVVGKKRKEPGYYSMLDAGVGNFEKLPKITKRSSKNTKEGKRKDGKDKRSKRLKSKVSKGEATMAAAKRRSGGGGQRTVHPKVSKWERELEFLSNQKIDELLVFCGSVYQHSMANLRAYQNLSQETIDSSNEATALGPLITWSQVSKLSAANLMEFQKSCDASHESNENTDTEKEVPKKVNSDKKSSTNTKFSKKYTPSQCRSLWNILSIGRCSIPLTDNLYCKWWEADSTDPGPECNAYEDWYKDGDWRKSQQYCSKKREPKFVEPKVPPRIDDSKTGEQDVSAAAKANETKGEDISEVMQQTPGFVMWAHEVKRAYIQEEIDRISNTASSPAEKDLQAQSVQKALLEEYIQLPANLKEEFIKKSNH